ncbi:extracellular solute-binding protein [Ramlibacter sp.]|uniref:ABC transporter substrate-binding protein n=1 Tax=Ramlibacter sp. TaxID=1917967 RepID=UPI0026340B2C|nr:extracellular solute-binding protein [Ramlibacter sp.]MDB5955229.1 Twin-arginine translocation pathway signal [Ramlibacter sp.]
MSMHQEAGRRQFLKTALVAGGAAAGLPGCATTAPDTLAQLYARARQEASVVYCGGGPAAAHRNSIEQFTKAYPGIEVKLVSGYSRDLVTGIDQQLAGNRVETDLATLQTIQDYVRWRRAGALLPYRGPEFGRVADTFKDPDGASVAVRVFALAYGYNPDLVAPQDVPKSALDFLHPRFSGKVISTYPHDDEITLYLYYTIVQKYGWGWLDRLLANQPRFIRGHLGTAQEVARGRAAVSFDISAGSTAAMTAAGGGRILVAFPAEDQVPIWETRCGIFKQAKHPNAAKLFQAFLLSSDYQARQGVWSTRTDATPAGGLKPIASYNVASQFKDFIMNEPLVADLRKRFEAAIGPVAGDIVL